MGFRECAPIATGAKIPFNLPIRFAGLQIVDILAGAMTRYLKWIFEGKKNEDRYAEALSTSPLSQFPVRAIWPSPDFTPEELGTIGPDAADPIEHFMKLTKDLTL